MTPEAKVKKAVRKILDEYEVYHFMPPANGYGHSGRFDICCSYFGHFIGIETKATSNDKPTALQIKNARGAWNSGASVLLINNANVDEIRYLLDRIKKNEGKKFERACVWPPDCRDAKWFPAPI